MDPLPPFHCRGIFIALIVLLLAFLRPTSTPQYPEERPADNPGKEVPMQNGQQVKIRQNAQGVVTGLTVDGSNGSVLFTRQTDGSFTRAQ